MASGAVVVFIAKAVISAAVAKAVGSITGNKTVGMLAGMAAGGMLSQAGTGAAASAGDLSGAAGQGVGNIGAETAAATTQSGLAGSVGTTAAETAGATATESAIKSGVGETISAGGAAATEAGGGLLSTAGEYLQKAESLADKYPKLMQIGGSVAESLYKEKEAEKERKAFADKWKTESAESKRRYEQERADLREPLDIDPITGIPSMQYKKPFEGRYTPLRENQSLLANRARQLEELKK